MHADQQPVIVGVGQETWREKNVSRTPIDALQAIISRAASDTGTATTLPAIDAVVHIPFILDQVPGLGDAMPRNPGAAVFERLGVQAQQYTADVGGNLPQQLVNDFAARLARGDHSVVVLCGVELLATFLGAVRSGDAMPDWSSGRDDRAQQIGETPTMTAGSEQSHGLFEPIIAYPLFESAIRHARGWSAAQHRALLGGLISRMSDVAAENPYAWRQRRYTAEEVVSTEAGNRMICHPYTKLMNSVIAVDQAAAVIMTTAGRARALGIDESRWIYLRGAAAARDSWYLSERTHLDRSPALQACVRAALAQASISTDELTHFDLYSCFPSAVQVACDAVGINVDDPRGVTVTGGMSLFGGPGNNYSLHAIAELCDRLRSTPAGAGLVSANGGYLTKHAVGIYARDPGASAWTPNDDKALQEGVAADTGPRLSAVGKGDFRIEAHTVKYQGDEPEQAILLGRLADETRCVSISRDAAVMTALIQEDCVTRMGQVEHSEGINTFSF